MLRVFKFVLLVIWVVGLAAAWWLVPYVPRYQIPADRSLVTVSRDGRTLLTISGSAAEPPVAEDELSWPSDEGQRLTARVYDASRGELHREFDVGQAGRLVVSPDASRLAIVRSGELAVWDLTRGELLSTLPMLWHFERGVAPPVALSADGRRLAYPAAAIGPPGRSDFGPEVKHQGVRIWDTHAQQELLALPDARVPLDISPDGKLLAAATEDHATCLWNIDTGELLAKFWPHSLRVTDVAFSADASRLASLSNTGGSLRDGRPAELRVYDVAERRERARVDVPGIDFTDIHFDSSGRLLGAGAFGMRMSWHIGESTLTPLEAELFPGAISADGSQLAMTSGEPVNMVLFAGYQDQYIRVIDTATNTTQAELRLTLPHDSPSSAQLSPLAYSSDGETLWVHVMCRDSLWRRLVTGRMLELIQPASKSNEFCGELWAVQLSTQRVRVRIPGPTYSAGAAIHWVDEGSRMLSRRDVGDQHYLTAWDDPPRRSLAVILILAALTVGTAARYALAAYWHGYGRSMIGSLPPDREMGEPVK